MQSIVTGLGKYSTKEHEIIENIIKNGYEKHKKDDVPIVVCLGDEDTQLPGRILDVDENIEDGTCSETDCIEAEDGESAELLRIASKAGDLVKGEKLGSNQFTVSDTFMCLTDVNALLELVDMDINNIDKFVESFYGTPDISKSEHESIKIYKTIIVNYSGKNKKLLAVILSRALGYVIAKDLILGSHILGEDDNVKDIDTFICRTALMIIAAYYSWRIMDDCGLHYKLRHNPDLENSAKVAMQAYILGCNKETDNETLFRQVYFIANYITLHYVINGTKLNVRSMFADGSSDYNKAIGAMSEAGYKFSREVIEHIYSARRDEVLDSLEQIVDSCITLVDKCETVDKLTNADIEPIEEIMRYADKNFARELDTSVLMESYRKSHDSSMPDARLFGFDADSKKRIDSVRKILINILDLR